LKLQLHSLLERLTSEHVESKYSPQCRNHSQPRRSLEKLYAYALKRVGNAPSRRGSRQNACSSAGRLPGSFASNSTLSTWLFGIMKFKILDHRAAKRTPTERAAAAGSNADGSGGQTRWTTASGGAWTVDEYGMDFLSESPDGRRDVRT
jgi:hypothetical protein